MGVTIIIIITIHLLSHYSIKTRLLLNECIKGEICAFCSYFFSITSIQTCTGRSMQKFEFHYDEVEEFAV